MPRTNDQLVKDLLGADYDPCRPLDVFIRSAYSMMTRVIACATDKGVTISTEDRKLIETWLAAYLYTRSDRVYTSRSNGASGSFADTANAYMMQAIQLDPSGCLPAILNRNTASMDWLGKPPSEQIDYVDRD